MLAQILFHSVENNTLLINFCGTLKLQTTAMDRRRLGLPVDVNLMAGDV